MKDDSFSMFLFFSGWSWYRRGAGCRRRTGVKSQYDDVMFFCKNSSHRCILENICHVSHLPPPAMCKYLTSLIQITIGEKKQINVKRNIGPASSICMCYCICECVWPPDSPGLYFVSLQGEIGLPGAEGEQGQEGTSVSNCKHRANPFLPCVWLNPTALHIDSLIFWWRCLIRQHKKKQGYTNPETINHQHCIFRAPLHHCSVWRCTNKWNSTRNGHWNTTFRSLI